MKTLIVYSSLPVSSAQLACAFSALAADGVAVTVRPLAIMRPAQLQAAEAQLLAVTLRLAEIGDRLTQAEVGLLRLQVGEEPGLRAEADDLRARKRGLLATIQALKGAQANG